MLKKENITFDRVKELLKGSRALVSTHSGTMSSRYSYLLLLEKESVYKLEPSIQIIDLLSIGCIEEANVLIQIEKSKPERRMDTDAFTQNIENMISEFPETYKIVLYEF